MKKLALIAALFVGLVMQAQVKDKAGKTGISNQEMQARVEKSVNEKIRNAQIEETKKAIDILKETQEVIAFIAQKKKKEAEEKLAEVIGKLEVLLAQKPELAFIPVSATTEVHDVVADLETVDKIMKQVRQAIDKGYYQVAKRVLNDLSSEIIVKTAYLPMATYPNAMKLAARLLHENKDQEAVGVLVQALSTLVIREEVLPLPVLRAEEYIKEAILVINNDQDFKDKKALLTALVNAADYQLTLAEKMGYGKRDKEYKELHDLIRTLKAQIEKGRERRSRKSLNKLAEKIKNFKERLFFNKA